MDAIIISHGSVQKPDTIDLGNNIKVVFGNFEEDVASYPKDNTMMMTVVNDECIGGIWSNKDIKGIKGIESNESIQANESIQSIKAIHAIQVMCVGPKGPIPVKPWTTMFNHQYILLLDRTYQLWVNGTLVFTVDAAYDAKIVNIHH